MYHTVQIAVGLSLLVTLVECRPAERAETTAKSPVDLLADVKEAVGYNLVQKRIIDFSHPKPIVDTITEDEKYGNVGEHQFGRAVVSGVAGVSRLVNSAFEVPKQVSKQAANKFTNFLDNLGGRLVGLQ